MPSFVPTVMILVRFRCFTSEKKNEKISQKSVKRENKTGKKKKKQMWTPLLNLNIKSQRNKTIVFNFECEFI